MEKLSITGGKRLKGEIAISGAKNAALPEMAASILADGVFKLERVPDLNDVRTMRKLLESLGAGCSGEGDSLDINTKGLKNFSAPYELVKTMRASVLVLGPLVARHGRARVSLPGGCAIGPRPVNLHIAALEKMGAKIKLEKGYIEAKAKRLKAANIYFDIVTVTGTENIMMAATLAKGTTVLENAAKEPEVTDLARMLSAMGAKIEGAGTDTIRIEGVDELRPAGHAIIPDRIECGTFMAIAGITGSELFLKGCTPSILESVITKLEETGMSFEIQKNGILAIGNGRPRAKDVRTLPYPGFPTDMQAQFMALMSIADGTSVVTETIFDNRFMHVAELRRLGADINVESGAATIRGVERLRGAELMATDLRASASLVVAALAAEGESVIDRIYHLDRGYEDIVGKLRKVGAKIERVS